MALNWQAFLSLFSTRVHLQLNVVRCSARRISCLPLSHVLESVCIAVSLPLSVALIENISSQTMFFFCFFFVNVYLEIGIKSKAI